MGQGRVDARGQGRAGVGVALLEYGVTNSQLAAGPNGPLQQALHQAKVWDQGAGATMGVLTERGLIETRDESVVIGTKLWIKLTPSGRATARAGGADDAAPARRKPKGLLSETLWSMLVAVYRAGDQGASSGTQAVPGERWRTGNPRSSPSAPGAATPRT
jgi:hypothetical protein